MADRFRVQDTICYMIDGIPHCHQMTTPEMGHILMIAFGLVASAFFVSGALVIASNWQIKRDFRKRRNI